MENLIDSQKIVFLVFFQFQKQQCLVPINTGKREMHRETSKHDLPCSHIGHDQHGGAHDIYFIFLGHLYIQYPLYMSCTVYMGISQASMF